MTKKAYVLFSEDPLGDVTFHAIFTSKVKLDVYMETCITPQRKYLEGWDWEELPTNPTNSEGL